LSRRLDTVLSPLRPARPARVDINLTWRCNLRCRHCFLRYQDYRELGAEDWKKILRSLKSHLGAFPVCLSGGEPLLHKDFFEIARFCDEIGLITILSTNGTLIDSGTAGRLAESNIDIVSISLESAREEVQDGVRGKGSWQKVMDAVMLLKERLPVQLSTVVMGCNIGELCSLADFAEKNGVHISFQGFYCAPDQLQGSSLTEHELWPRGQEAIAGEFDRLIALKAKTRAVSNSVKQLELLREYYLFPQRLPVPKKKCRAFLRAFELDPEGKMQFCSYGGPVGDLTRQSMRQIWASPEISRIVRAMKSCPKDCSYLNCRHEEGIGDYFHKLLAFLAT